MPLFELPVFNVLSGLSQAKSPLPVMPIPLLAEISGSQWIAIVAIGGGISLAAVVIIFGLKFVQRRQELWHETARVALEKSQPLPPLPRDMQPEQPSESNNDFRAGLILVAIGAGLYLFFISLFGGWMKYLGAIPGFIGLALLLYATMNALFSRKNPPADRP